MADWTTCRVVRDRDGDLWGHDTAWTEPSYRRWVKLGGYWEEDGCFQIHMEPRHGPLTPVLDADGLPVVHTVGDLTARHIGRRVRVEGWGETVFREVFPTQHGARCMFADGDHEFAATIGIPCEVLP